jgi:hypothetical protein
MVRRDGDDGVLEVRCQATPTPPPTTLPHLNVNITGIRKLASIVERETVRMALPSKGRMAEDTLALLQECELSVRKLNPRQYIADISEVSSP